MVLLAGLVTYWKTYFGDIKLHKYSRTGSSDDVIRYSDTLLNPTRNDIPTRTYKFRSNVECQNVFKIGSKKYPVYERYDMNASTVKNNAKDISATNVVAMIEDLGRATKSQHDELNEQIADLQSKFLTMRNEMEQMGRQKT